MVLGGAVLRWKFRIDLGTLSKINIYFLLPAFVFDKVSTSQLQWTTMGGIMAISTTQVLVLGVLVAGLGRLFGVGRKTLAAVALAVMFYNSGNYGLPLAELAFGQRGSAAQSFVMLTQNVLTFTVGLGIAVWAGAGSFGKGMITLFRLPVLPTLFLSLLAKWWLDADPSHELPKGLTAAVRYVANGLVPVALITLGAQLASNPRWPRWKPVGAVIVIRLVLAPIIMAGMLYGLHRLSGTGSMGQFVAGLDLWPWPAQLLILTAAVPTAVNTLLLTLELEGDADLAADCVFWTTVFSSITIGAWLFIIEQVAVFS